MFLIPYGALFLAVVIVMALPGLIRFNSGEIFFANLLNVIAGILIPVGIFLLSGAYVPEWTGEATNGWIDCFHYGKIALFPLVVWGTTAFYALEIWRVENRHRGWIVMGIFIGAIVSTTCLICGIITFKNDNMAILLVVPLYTAIWYTGLAASLMRDSGFKVRHYLYTLIGSLPFWIYGIILSKQKYASLPTSPPACFIVTAAAQGHKRIVRPFTTTVRGERVRQVNRQLLRFWEFEAMWRRRMPRLHRLFRRFYNVWGYRASRLIRTPAAADLVYLALKPFEAVVLTITIIAGCRSGEKKKETFQA